MFTAKTYLLASSLEEAYDALQKNKTNTLVAGCCWLKMTRKRIWTAVDISRLGLDSIVPDGDTLQIGAMASLHSLETNPAVKGFAGGILSEAVRRIVGVQFRNCATVGGCVWMRAGFSDLLTALLALDTTVCLYHAGQMPLDEFLASPVKKDILTHIIVRGGQRRAAYVSMRLTETDFPVLTAAVSLLGEDWRVVLGARPGLAARCERAENALGTGDRDAAIQAVRDDLRYGGNLRASEAYRRQVAGVLLARAVEKLAGEGAAE